MDFPTALKQFESDLPVRINWEVGAAPGSIPGAPVPTAQTRPPHLSAITPLSVIDDTYRGTLWPGGILNTGFATPWATQRAADAAPYGEGWEAGMNNPTCDANQLVRLQNPDPVSLIEDNPFYNRSYYQRIDPSRFVQKIDVPVYIAGAWQDEQTGGHFPAFLNRFTGSPHLYATLTNGSHTESLDTLSSFARYADFLDLYVGRRVPQSTKNFVGPLLVQTITGISGVTMPPSHDYTGDSYPQAKRWFESQPPVQVQFEEGAAKGEPSGAPVARFVHRFASWPVPSAKARRFYLRSGGSLSRSAPGGPAKARSFSADPSALPATDYTGSSSAIWGAHPAYDWRQIPKGKGLGWITAPLKKDLVMVGGGSLDVWVKTPAKDVDLEATVSDVRPSGREVYVQSGWLRASHRHLNTRRSTVLRPVHTDREGDAREMPIGRYQLLRIEIPAVAQPFRAGDRLRITLDAPGGAKPLWAFRTLDRGQRVTVATDRAHPSSIVLSVVPGIAVPRQAPPCRSLRSQPCRTYAG
jgi:putative CocE/NonD family hydrolase